MRKLIVLLAMLFTCSSYGADSIVKPYTGYGASPYQPPIIAPNGTTRIQQRGNGHVFYDKNGYAGRSYNTGNGGTIIYGRDGRYDGRSFQTGNGGYRFLPNQGSPTYTYGPQGKR